MKKIIFLCLLGLLFAVTLGFTACSDDDESNASVASLANTKMYVYAEENYLDGEKVKGYPFTPKYWTFFSDGTCSGFMKGTWEMKGNSILVTTSNSGMKETHVCKIIESNRDVEAGTWELVLREEYDDDEFDYQLYYMRLVEVFEDNE